MQCVYAVRGSKNTLFSTYCTLLLFLYAPPFWNVSIFTKLILLRSEGCSDGQLSSALWLAEYLNSVMEMLRPYHVVMPCPGATRLKQ